MSQSVLETGPASGPASFLEFERVSVARGDAVVLHDISLTIARGEHIAILGPNGCGKSTLIKTITREVYPMVTPGMRCRMLGSRSLGYLAAPAASRRGFRGFAG